MEKKYGLTIYNSKRDIYGNCYYAFSFIEYETGKVVQGTISGNNISMVPYYWTVPNSWDNSKPFIIQEQELKIREFNRLTKSWKYAGCNPKELVTYIKKELVL